MQNAFTFIIVALSDLYVITFFLRLAMGWVRADFRNPMAQFIVKVTNPLVMPARRFIPPFRGLDLATLTVLVVLQCLTTALLVQLACVGDAAVGQVIVFALMRLVHLVLNMYFWLLLVYVVASWVSQGGYNPALAVLAALVEPLLAPLRRLIPAISGLDLSPIFAFLAIGFLQRLIPSGQQLSGLLCVGF
jgi:YggT family protein